MLSVLSVSLYLFVRELVYSLISKTTKVTSYLNPPTFGSEGKFPITRAVWCANDTLREPLGILFPNRPLSYNYGEALTPRPGLSPFSSPENHQPYIFHSELLPVDSEENNLLYVPAQFFVRRCCIASAYMLDKFFKGFVQPLLIIRTNPLNDLYKSFKGFIE